MSTTRGLVLSAGLFCAAAVGLYAQSYYEGFDYTVGATVATQTNGGFAWASANTGTAPTIATGSLSVSGLPASTGNSASLPGGNFQEAIATLPTTYTTGTVFYSFALQLSALPSGTGTYSFALSTGGTNYGAVIYFQLSGLGYNVGLANRSSGSTATYDTTVYNLSDTIYLVGSYTFVSGTANDASALWINPSSSTFGSTPATATLSSVGGTDLAAINQILIRGATGSPAGLVDEFRIGTSYAAVTSEISAVPEPSAYAAIAGALVLAGVIFQRRRKL